MTWEASGARGEGYRCESAPSNSSVARPSRPDPRGPGRGPLLHSFVQRRLPAPASPAPPTPPRPGSASRRSAPRLRWTPRRAAKTWFMAPDARCGSGNGTLENPWCIQDALESRQSEARRHDPGPARRHVQAAGDGRQLRADHGDARGLARPAHHRTSYRSGPDHSDDADPDRMRPARARKRRPTCVSIESNWVDYYDFEVANFGDPQAPTDHRPVRPAGLRDRRADHRRRQKVQASEIA